MLILNSRDFWTCLFSSHAYLRVMLIQKLHDSWSLSKAINPSKSEVTWKYYPQACLFFAFMQKYFATHTISPSHIIAMDETSVNYDNCLSKTIHFRGDNTVSRNLLSIMVIFASMLILSSSSFGSCLFTSHAYYRVNAYFRETTVPKKGRTYYIIPFR